MLNKQLSIKKIPTDKKTSFFTSFFRMVMVMVVVTWRFHMRIRTNYFTDYPRANFLEFRLRYIDWVDQGVVQRYTFCL